MRTTLFACLPLLGLAGCATGPGFAAHPGGRMPARDPEWTINGSLGGGTFSHKNFGPTTLDDDADATMFRFRLERVFHKWLKTG